jgi:hypothetical protein
VSRLGAASMSSELYVIMPTFSIAPKPTVAGIGTVSSF